MPQNLMRVQLPMQTRPANDTLFTVTNTGEATTVRDINGWKSALTATAEAQISRVDFNGDLLLDVNKLKLVRWRVMFGAMPAGTNFFFGLAAANNATLNDITARVLFQLKGSHVITARTDDGVVDSGDIATPWTAASGQIWEFVVDFAGGLQSQIPAYLSRRGKGALQLFGGRVGQSLQPLMSFTPNMGGYSAGLQLFSRLEKASGTGLGDATMKFIEYELDR
jgi:hypothetical protein